MRREENIFYRLTRENENSTTELLCNLFRTKFIRDICLKYFSISDDIIENIDFNSISTQKSFDKEGIPDIKIQNTNSLFIIENKIRRNTNLQENQKNGYISRIISSSKQNKGYIFIIPENYIHEEELFALSRKYKFIKIIYWENFFKYLLKLEIQNESPVIKESIDYLIHVVLKDTSLYNEEIIFSAYEVIMLHNPKDVLESLRVCQKVFSKIKSIEDNLLKIKDFHLSAGNDNDLTSFDEGIGKYFWYNNKECIFIGLNMNLITYNKIDINDSSKRADEYLFSIAFNKSYMKPDLKISVEYFDDGEYIYIPLNKKYLIEKNTGSMESEIEKIIREVFLKNAA